MFRVVDVSEFFKLFKYSQITRNSFSRRRVTLLPLFLDTTAHAEGVGGYGGALQLILIYGAWPPAVSRFEIAITFERIGLFAQNFQGCFTMVGAMFWQGF